MSYLIFFDLETGGVQLQHPTISLGAVAVVEQGFDEVGSFSQHIAFKVEDCDPEALKLNGYTAEAWKDAVPPRIAASKFAAWLRPYMDVPMVSQRTGKGYTVAKLAGYNAVSFDLPRLKALFGTDFFPCSYLVRDVMQRVLFYFDEQPNLAPPQNFKLGTVCGYFDLANDGAHDALADARMTAKLAARLRQEERIVF